MAGIKDLITQIPPEYRLYLQTMLPGQKTGTIDESYFSKDFKDQLKDQVLSKIEMGLGFDSPPVYDESMRFMFPYGTVRKGTILPQDYRTAANPAGTTDPKYYKGERGSSPTGYSSPFNTLGTYQYEYKMPTAPAFDNAAIVVTDKYDWNPTYGTVPAQNFTGYIDKGFGEKGDEDYVEGSDVDAKMLFEFVKNQIKNKELDTASALELIGNYLGPKESKGEGKDIKITIPVDTPTATTDDRKKDDEIRRKDLQHMRGPIGRDNRSVDTSRGAVRGAQQDISNYQDFGEVPLAEGGRVGYALGSPEPLNVSNEEKRIAFDLYQTLKDIEEQYTGETIAGDPSPQNLDPSDRRQETLMASGDFPEFENYADVIDAYNSGVAVEPGESLTDYIKRNNIKIKEIEMDPLGDLEKTFKGAAGGRVNLQGGTDPKTGQGFQKGNVSGVKENILERNLKLVEEKNKKVLRAKQLIMAGDTPAEAKKKVIKEFNLDRDPKAGTPRWLKQAKEELTNEGFKFTASKPGPENVGGKDTAAKKREQVIGKGKTFEERLKKEKTKTGFGKRFETAHTANIFQAKALGMDYPIDALAIQATDVNQVIAEGLNDELKPLYKKQLTLVNKLKKNNTFALRKEVDDINFKISETVATGGKQGNKAANVLKPIIVDPQNLKGKILDLGFKTSDEVLTLPGATTKETKAGTIEDLMARMNIKEKVLSKASDLPTPEKTKVRDMFKKAFSVGKTVAKPVLRAAAPFIPVLGAVGVGLGAADVAKASEFTKKPDELGLAYLLGPEKAKDYSQFKESIRGKADETEEFVP